MPRNRINGFHKAGLISASALWDMSQFIFGLIPFGGVLAGMLGFFTLWIWFKVLNVGFSDTIHRYLVNITALVCESMPLVNFLPMRTIGTIIIIRQVRDEDRKYNEAILNGGQNGYYNRV